MELIGKYLPGPTPTPSFWFWHHPFPTVDLWCQARKNEACIHLLFMIYNLYFFRKTEIEKSTPLGHLIATLLSSSSLDHILDPTSIYTCSSQYTGSMDKEVGRSPAVSRSAKGSKQTDARYLKGLIHRGYTTVCLDQTVFLCLHVRLREGRDRL